MHLPNHILLYLESIDSNWRNSNPLQGWGICCDHKGWRAELNYLQELTISFDSVIINRTRLDMFNVYGAIEISVNAFNLIVSNGRL